MKTFLGKKIFMITAHPEDESYVAAGTLHKNIEAGGGNALVCATPGPSGTSRFTAQRRGACKRR